MKNFLYLIISLLFIISAMANAYSAPRRHCARTINKGWWKRYKYHGDTYATPATSRHGSRVTPASTTESLTVLVDPKWYFNVTTSSIQGTSSWGKCALITMTELKKNRNMYALQNVDQIKREIAAGTGKHLQVLASFSFCEKKVINLFNAGLQKNLEKFINVTNKNVKDDVKSEALGVVIDNIIKHNAKLVKSCYVISQLNTK